MMTNKKIEEILNNQETKPEGLTFPCDYPVKAMGPNTEKFKQEMLFIAQKYCTRAEEKHLRSSLSKTGKYQSVTITIIAKSRTHLEEIYAELKSHKDVKWTL
jgi:putative lipoic acid-binding regulatory protein